MLFPLPLTAFENYMLADDRAEYPMCFFLRLHFWGTLERRSFEIAVEKAVERHPLLQAVVRQVDGQAAWVDAEDVRPLISWEEADEPSPEAPGYLDLSHETGLRVMVSQNSGRAQVLFQFHHACSDGVGAVQFIEDVLAIYSSEFCGATQPARLRPVQSQLLAGRGRHGLSTWGRVLRMPLDSLAAYGIAQFFGNRPKAIETAVARQSVEHATSARPTSVSERISPEQLKALKAAAKREGVTVNDLLIRDLLLAIDKWNAVHNHAARGGCLRISVPVNLRLAADAALPVTNNVSMVFMDRRVKESTNPKHLLRSIWFDTWFIKRFRLALVFTWIVELLHGVRGGFDWLLGGKESLATAVLSNLGVQFDDLPLAYAGDRVIAGNAVLDTIDFLPPIRPKTSAAFGVTTYAGELMLSLQYDSRALGAAAAGDLLTLFREQLLHTTGVVPADSIAPIADETLVS